MKPGGQGRHAGRQVEADRKATAGRRGKGRHGIRQARRQSHVRWQVGRQRQAARVGKAMQAVRQGQACRQGQAGRCGKSGREADRQVCKGRQAVRQGHAGKYLPACVGSKTGM